MAYPSVDGSDIYAQTASGVAHNGIVSSRSVPAGGLLVVLVASKQGSITQSVRSGSTSGWTIKSQANQGAVWVYKNTTGSTINVTLNITTDNNTTLSAWGRGFTGADDVYADSVGTSTSSPNPPNVAPGIGSKEFYLIVAAYRVTTDVGANSVPSGYTDEGTIGASPAIQIATRTETVSSKDPAAFSYSGSALTPAWNIMVSPVNLITSAVTAQLAALTTVSAAKLKITGSSSKTLALLTTVSNAKLKIAGSATALLASLTTASAAQLKIAGSATILLAPLTTDSAANLIIGATASIVFEPLTMLSEADLKDPLNASLFTTLAPLTMTAMGSVYDPGGFAFIRLAPLITASAGNLRVKGTTFRTLAQLTMVSSGKSSLRATVTRLLAPLTSVSAAKLKNEGAVTVSFQPLTLSSSTKLPIKATMPGVFAPLTLTGTIQYVIQAITPDGRILKVDFGNLSNRTVVF